MNKILVILFLIIGLQSYGQSNFSNFSTSQSECDDSFDSDKMRNRVSSHLINGKQNSITIGFSGNCCAEYEPNIKISKDTIFINRNNVSEDDCWCNCCFSMVLNLTTENKIGKYFLGKKEIFLSDNPY